ncbi:MAG: universal stress protein [Pseudomonadota bacterium]
MYKTIVCAIEIGKEGRKVLTKAKQLAQLFDSTLIVVNVLPYSFLPKDYERELKEEAIPEFHAFVSKFDIPKKNRVLKVGKPYAVICNIAHRKKADLIILGTHSKSGVRALIGSTATGVANTASCDVSLVRV